ncbi:hypothetical protein B0H19DRAFT_1085809 [Mycena capillaripes]|nr:hypothetical protein B0H19DRAFT_1085809 [Mycena capillaripes]
MSLTPPYAMLPPYVSRPTIPPYAPLPPALRSYIYDRPNLPYGPPRLAYRSARPTPPITRLGAHAAPSARLSTLPLRSSTPPPSSLPLCAQPPPVLNAAVVPVPHPRHHHAHRAHTRPAAALCAPRLPHCSITAAFAPIAAASAPSLNAGVALIHTTAPPYSAAAAALIHAPTMHPYRAHPHRRALSHRPRPAPHPSASAAALIHAATVPIHAAYVTVTHTAAVPIHMAAAVLIHTLIELVYATTELKLTQELLVTCHRSRVRLPPATFFGLHGVGPAASETKGPAPAEKASDSERASASEDAPRQRKRQRKRSRGGLGEAFPQRAKKRIKKKKEQNLGKADLGPSLFYEGMSNPASSHISIADFTQLPALNCPLRSGFSLTGLSILVDATIAILTLRLPAAKAEKSPLEVKQPKGSKTQSIEGSKTKNAQSDKGRSKDRDVGRSQP